MRAMAHSGREVAEAISSMLNVDVLLARMAPALQTRSSFSQHFFLEGHAFENSFNHNVRFREIVVAQRWLMRFNRSSATCWE